MCASKGLVRSCDSQAVDGCSMFQLRLSFARGLRQGLHTNMVIRDDVIEGCDPKGELKGLDRRPIKSTSCPITSVLYVNDRV